MYAHLLTRSPFVLAVPPSPSVWRSGSPARMGELVAEWTGVSTDDVVARHVPVAAEAWDDNAGPAPDW